MSTSEQLEKGRRMMQQLEGRVLSDEEDGSGGAINQVFPDFWEMMVGHLFGEVFTRTGITLRERLVVNLTCLIFHKHNPGIARCMHWCLNNGITREEILEIVMHVAHYAGWPCGSNAIHVAGEALPPAEKVSTGASEEKELSSAEWVEKGWQMSQQLRGDSSRPTILDDVFPDFGKMHRGHLFGEVWSRPGLPFRERIMVNLTCVFFHKYEFGIANTIRWALNNGISKEAIEEIVIHVAHYAGWPCGVNARRVAAEVFAERE
ncbi:carboxymuconolactone decarboxylase family protein [Chloroflexota bacterium]